jgi:hypothetical protein
MILAQARAGEGRLLYSPLHDGACDAPSGGTMDLESPDVLAAVFDEAAAAARALRTGDVDELTAVEGLFWVMEFSSMVLEVYSHRDSVHPVVLPIVTPFRRFMGDHCFGRWNYVAELDPACEYRLSCRPGDAVFHSITVQDGGGLPLAAAATVLGKLNHRELAYEPDGSFAVLIGGEPQPTNWVPLGDAPAGLLTREFFYASPEVRTEAVWRIENLTGGAPQRPADAHLAASLRSSLETFVDAAHRYPLPVGQALFAQGGVNAFAELTHFTESNTPTWGNLDAFHTTMPYDLGPDDAIVIDGEPVVPCAWWGITQNNRFVASFGAGERTGLHGEEIAVNDDGSWQAVLAGRDPGHPNWLSTAGHQHGIVRIRWLIADREPLRPRTTTARISDLAR